MNATHHSKPGNRANPVVAVDVVVVAAAAVVVLDSMDLVQPQQS